MNNYNNEIGRKITSLTLMTIMIAGGMTFAMPSMMPAAEAANANLFVSTERFGGPMIVEIVVTDPNYDDDTEESMPDVTIDGHDLVMAQGSDGSWYAYVAEADMVNAANATANGLDFGFKVDKADYATYFGSDFIGKFDDSATVYATDSSHVISVLTNTKSLSTTSNLNKDGQIGLSQDNWPLIQAFDFTVDSDIQVIYGSSQSQTAVIEYTDDMDDYASYSTDRTQYPHDSHIHLVIDDMQLNIDPTDEDKWTFNTHTFDSFYRSSTDALDSDGQNALHYGDNGFLRIDEQSVIVFSGNSDDHASLNNDPSGFYVTVEETGTNSGSFENTDSANESNLRITSDKSLRGTGGVVNYNDESSSILVKFFGGTIKYDLSTIDDDWNSGEELTINIDDQDENTNTKSSDDFDVTNPIIDAIPTYQSGDPFTLDDAQLVSITGQADVSASQDLLDELSDDLAVVQSFIPGNQTAWDDIVNNKTSISQPIQANLTQYETFVTLNTTAVTNAYSSGASSGVIDALEALLANAELGVSQLQDALDNVYDVSELQVKAELDDLLSQRDSLQDQINALQNTINGATTDDIPVSFTVAPFSKIMSISPGSTQVEANPTLVISTGVDSSFLNEFVGETGIHTAFNYELTSVNATKLTISGENSGSVVINNPGRGLVYHTPSTDEFSGNLVIEIETEMSGGIYGEDTFNIVFDVFVIGQTKEGDRYNDAIYRLEADETNQNTGIYRGTIEYIMLNQINIHDDNLLNDLDTIDSSLTIIVHEDLSDEDAVSVNYLDRDGQGSQTQISAKIDAPTYSGLVTFDQTSYKIADTVFVTVYDADLNTDSSEIDIYTVIDNDSISVKGIPSSRLLDVLINDSLWASCTVDGVTVPGLAESMNTIVESKPDSGVFEGSFQIPSYYCDTNSSGDEVIESSTGRDLQINYVDFRDVSGEEIEVGASAGIRANTGSVSLDRTVYPTPFGTPEETDDERGSFFKVHETAIGNKGDALDDAANSGLTLDNGDLTIHVRITDPDFDVSASGEDEIADPSNVNGPIKVMIKRGSETLLLGTAGAATTSGDTITIGETPEEGVTREFGPISEIAPDAGIFELDMTIRYTDGPAGDECPTSTATAVSHIEGDVRNHCILQGDILSVEYTDPTDASGDPNTVTDSAAFDLRNGVLQADKSVYIIGSDMILTLIEPDFDLDNDQAETYSLDLIEWDSDAATTTMGDEGVEPEVFDPEPSALRETGDSTGIFQVVVEMPASIDGNNLERGEEIVLEYTDWGPSGANYVGHEDEDVNLTLFTSNFGATVELDQKVYSWTDKVYITIVAPDHNFDSDLVDEIGDSSRDPIKVATRGHELDQYKLVETGTDTGIFTGEVILTGFQHDADGVSGFDTNPRTEGSGPTGGFLQADDDDGLTVSFEFSEDESVVGSALIRWNIGELQWLEASYPATGTGVVRVIDPDMNLDPEAVDNFNIDVWSDSDAGGIDLTVTETNEATGIFEGTVFFTVDNESSGHRLRVAESDTVTAEYEDNTLPDPYTKADELDVTATTLIGTIVPPLERAPAANLRTVDAFGNSLDSVSVDQQVQVTADLSNGQDREQSFAYLVQIQDANGVTVSLAWITGSLTSGQVFSPALSWVPANAGTYSVTAFVWESVDNPTALSPPVSSTIVVS